MEARRGVGSPPAAVTGCPTWVLELNSAPLQEQFVLLIAKSSPACLFLSMGDSNQAQILILRFKNSLKRVTLTYRICK